MQKEMKKMRPTILFSKKIDRIIAICVDVIRSRTILWIIFTLRLMNPPSKSLSHRFMNRLMSKMETEEG